MLKRIAFVVASLVVASAALWETAARAADPPRPMKSLPVTPGSAFNAHSPLGTNLNGVTDWSAEWAFTDAFKASRDWISSSATEWDDKRPIDVDADGWVRSLLPGQWARTVMLWDLDPAAVPAGEVVITYKGTGVLEVWPQEVLAQQPGRIVVRHDPKKAGISLVIKETAKKDPVRDIHVWMPGFGDMKEPPTFHPAFLERVRAYKVLRFMDWMDTNHSKQRHWRDRPRREHARWTHGVPAEVIAELANTLKADAWITVPHLADDAYVTELAKTLHKTLDPERALYVEYSNEVWNGIFGQAAYALAEGKKRGLGSADFEAQLQFYAQRSVEVFRIFERVFGGTKRLVRVMGSQGGNAWVSETVLSHKDAWRHTDALAIAPYFGSELGMPESQSTTQRMTLDQLMDWLRTKSLDGVRTWIKDQRAVAERFGVPLIAYEGGQHLAGVGPSVDDDKINALFDAANKDPRMKDIYAAYLKAWKDGGGGLFVHFVNTAKPSKWGRWGAATSQLEPRASAPKYDALLTFIEAHDRGARAK